MLKILSAIPCLLMLVLCLACGGGDGGTTDDDGGVPRELFEAVEVNPDDPEARRALALALHHADRKEEATAQYETLVEKDPAKPHLFDLARAYLSVLRISDAEAVYRRILEGSPDDTEALYDMGNIALARQDVPGAIEFYNRVLELQPKHLLALHNVGTAYQVATRFREAYRTFEQVVELDPVGDDEVLAFDDALYRLGALDLQMGATERAAQLLKVLVDASPEHAMGHYTYGQALMKLDRPEEAEKEFAIHRRLTGAAEPPQPVTDSAGG